MRLFGHYVLGSRVRLFVAEQAALGVLFLAAVAAAGHTGPGALGVAMLCALALQTALYLGDLYDLRERLDPSRWFRAAGLGALLPTVVWGAAGGARPGVWLGALSLSLVVALLLRGLTLGRARRVLVYGTGPRAHALDRILADSAHDCVAVGFVPGPDEEGPAAAAPSPVLIARDEPIDRVARGMGADVLVVALDSALPEEALARARASGVEVVSAGGFVERYARRLPVELLVPGELVFGDGFYATRASDVVQRALDVLAASVLLVLAAPVLAVAALAIRLDSRGPVFYSQARVGRHGRVYRVTKLRSMRVDAEAAGTPQWAQRHDPRVTRVGRLLRKSRVDELPQLFAVMRGDMSLVGPRPERPYFVEQLKAQVPYFGLREAVKPGVTGWAQINYPYGATVEDARSKLEYDLYYLRHRSVFLNLSILFHTVRTVLTGRGAH